MSGTYLNYHRLFFKGFSNRTRFEIISLLQRTPLTVNEIAKKLNFEQSRVSHNLRCLERCGFVTIEEDGRYRRYTLDSDTIVPMLKLVNNHITKYKGRLKACGVIA